jgi:predicted unusual protein kinase regulating ubiquinone biosynthesis (AarF/ABC1/UbiB family)
VLADGRPVAVKVQYPRIVDALQVDLGQAAALDRVLSLFLRGQSRAVMIEELRARILEECDYRLEAGHQRRFAEFFAGRADVRIPDVVADFSSRRVLTTELATGQPLDRFAAAASAADRNRAAQALLDFYLQSAFQHDCFNTDPNPGNFLFAGDRVTFLDFGRIVDFSPGFAAGMRGLLRATLERDRAGVRAWLIRLGIVPDPDRFDFDRAFLGLLLLYRPYLSDQPFTFTREHLQRTWRAIVRDNPNLTRTNFVADLVFLHQFHFGVASLLVRLGATLAYRDRLVDLLYRAGEARPAPFTSAELALLGI